jgi:hypothetical protein
MEFGQFSVVPSFGSTYQITGDTLELVYICSATLWTYGEVVLGIFVAAVHTTVTVVV